MPLAQTGSIQTYYELYGDSDDTIVFIHGAGASHDMWSPQVDYFTKTHRVLTYDLRGHQQSEGSDDIYTCQLFADDLHQLLEHLEIENPVIVGLSLGGMIAQEYAIKYHSNLSGLVLCDTAVASALTLSDKLTKAIYPKSLLKWTINRMSDERYAEWSFKYFEMDDEIRDYLIQEQLKMKKEELIKVMDAIYSFKLLPLKTIKVPTLVVLGENERKAVFPHADKMIELIENSRKVIVPKAGHVSNLENPEFFNRELEKLLQEAS
ncbi:alpha/beta hydrolase [Candidatus Thorarchaeota archaeon]|nr:MAG: alpha/beta hydrolase [Candidatus Thorarchaeota archaeon]